MTLDVTLKPSPPILMNSVLEFTKLCKGLSKIIGKHSFFCKSSNDNLKIQTANPEAYRTFVRYLKNNNA